MSKVKSYSVWADVRVVVTVSIAASDLADAVEKTKKLQPTDFVKILGEYQDTTGFHIQGVLEDE